MLEQIGVSCICVRSAAREVFDEVGIRDVSNSPRENVIALRPSVDRHAR
jgi:hypothetical protein